MGMDNPPIENNESKYMKGLKKLSVEEISNKLLSLFKELELQRILDNTGEDKAINPKDKFRMEVVLGLRNSSDVIERLSKIEFITMGDMQNIEDDYKNSLRNILEEKGLDNNKLYDIYNWKQSFVSFNHKVFEDEKGKEISKEEINEKITNPGTSSTGNMELNFVEEGKWVKH
jgi:hypothetical protein